MARIALALALLGSLATQAHAGYRCAKRPEMVVFTPAVQLDEDGHYALHKGEQIQRGTISKKAVQRVDVLASAAKTKPDQLVRCIDALSKDEASKASRRACRVTSG